MTGRRVGTVEPGSIRVVLPNYPNSVRDPKDPEDTEAIEVVSLPH